MEPNDFDFKIAIAVKTFRILKGVKQINIALALNISEGAYCDLENAYRPMLVEELHDIASFLEVTVCQIIGLAQSDTNLNCQLKPTSALLTEWGLTYKSKREDVGFTNDELYTLIEKIKKVYNNA